MDFLSSKQLETRVIDKNTEKDTDVPLSITIEVDDINDNAPTFTNPLQFTVPEKSKAGEEYENIRRKCCGFWRSKCEWRSMTTFWTTGEVVGKVNATDRDKEGTRHVKIRYTLLDGLDLFAINPETGVITTRTNTLDREVSATESVIDLETQWSKSFLVVSWDIITSCIFRDVFLSLGKRQASGNSTNQRHGRCSQWSGQHRNCNHYVDWYQRQPADFLKYTCK